ncbi:MAG TPA: glycoside hydrolase family 2 TIM barrel-domain containing protein [Planctomycetota bacterium]|nr:glycoside hydrolase family 2 TIM barrel-domain containing protein [Planctomycetota bacterium]
MRWLSLLLLPLPLLAQERVSLDGAWTLRAEPLDESHLSVKNTVVPSAFETTLGSTFDGVAWYRRALPLPAERCQRVRVEFAAVATHATVFCNGKEVGQHLGGWTPFRVDLTDALLWNGQDCIEVRVDEKVGHNTQGFLPIIQPHFGGIWQGTQLCLDRGPVIDRLGLFLFGKGNGELLYAIPTLGPSAGRLEVVLTVRDGAEVHATTQFEVEPGLATTGVLNVPSAQPWSPLVPHLYTVHAALRAEGRPLDEIECKVGFRDLRADGTRILWNGLALQVRGILHWGYSPPHLAPPTDPAFWRRQLQDFKAMGFNCLKCCLWVPPTCVHDLCDELGLLVWQEYPTWHPHMDQAHKQELLAEYGEFFAHDRNHPSVAFRSITCETGQSADLDVVKALFEACKTAVPDTLVVDDSSWIGWQRITDFWDEHPYGNNRWWPGRLQEFLRHIEQHGQKPLLLGECIAADTWADSTAWQQQHSDDAVWWRPDCLPDQERFEAWVEREFGASTLASLGPVSRDYAMRTRRYQIERLRVSIPDAGYVVSVARDFAKARMGLYDDFDRLKWSAEQWSWHGDTMLCLDTPGDARAFVVTPDTEPAIAVRVVKSPEILFHRVFAPFPLTGLPTHVDRPTRHRLQCDPARIPAYLAAERPGWDIWLLPPFENVRPANVRVVEHLDVDTLAQLENGARVLLHATGKKHSVRTEKKWYLTGAPFAPPHAVHERLPAEMLIELQPFDLDGGHLVPWGPWLDQVDPILAFWETHDIAEVRAHLFAFDCNVGAGRLLVSAFDTTTPAGRYVEQELLRHLCAGPAPKRSLSAATLAALRATLTEKKIDLPVWRFRTDPNDEGRAANWHDPATDVAAAPWRDLKAGSHWENQAKDLEHYTGVAWYRVDIDVPADWAGIDARAVFEGVDDSFELWLNGEPAGNFGDAATKTTIWLERQTAELAQRLRGGARNTLVLRVVDHGGAGGLWKPAFLTTGPAAATSRFLN